MEKETRVSRKGKVQDTDKKQRSITGLAILYVVLNSSTGVECVRFLLSLIAS